MKISSSKVVIDDRKKKPVKTAGNYTRQETPARGHGGSNAGEYGTHEAPRVGGKAPKASGLKGASKSQVKKAKKMVSKNTGSGASKQAKMAALRAY